jgi:DNA-binding NtrC family response regulator
MGVPQTRTLSMAIIDDNLDNLELMREVLQSEGIDVHYFSDPEAGLDFVRRNRPHIVLTDLVMPEIDGIEVLDRILAFDPTIDVILITAYYSSDSAVKAIQNGATDYLDKPISIDKLRARVKKLAALHRARMAALDPDRNGAESHEFEGMIGNSPQMWKLYSQIQRVAPHYRSLLVRGATGTGKELVALALHRLSGVPGEFVALNCSAVVENLFESELFGHVKGSFTGALGNKVGLFEHANHGTLFLDEIGDMPMSTQAKLLRALQNQEVQPLGSLQARKVDVRVVAATHRDLRAMMTEGRFREDLFYRLSMVELQVPGLTHREGDVELLARSFVKKAGKQYGRDLQGLTQRGMVVLKRHHWPGNVRELENVIGHAAMMASGPLVDATDFPSYLVETDVAAGEGKEEGGSDGGEQDLTSLARQEKQLLMNALERSGMNQSKAARSLGISRDRLRYRMKKYELS